MNTTKKVTTAKKVEEKKVNNVEVIDNATLVALRSKVNFEKKEKDNSISMRTKNFIYKFETRESLTDKESKKKRSKLRKDLQKIIDRMILSNHNKTDLSLCEEFINFYKLNYVMNDYSLQSFTNSQDEDKRSELQFCIELCKVYLTNKK